jgi:hypothetical protein
MTGSEPSSKEREAYFNSPESFQDLSKEQQKMLIDWIKRNFAQTKNMNRRHTSYGLMHIFEYCKGSFNVTNGQIKGAMLKCGFKSNNMQDANWYFGISEKSIREWEEAVQQ